MKPYRNIRRTLLSGAVALLATTAWAADTGLPPKPSVGEIVTPQTGALVDVAASPAEVAAALSGVLEQGRFQRQPIHANFQANFDAGVNYNRLADALIALHGNEAASDRPRVRVQVGAEPHRP